MIAKVVVHVVLLAALGLLLFISAGTWNWPAAWVLLAEMGGSAVLLGWWLGRHDPALLAERLSPNFQSEQPSWDKALVAALMVWSVVSFVLMAFDAVRFGWSHVPLLLQVVGALLVLLNGVVAYRTFRANTYASTVVKIQAERGHQVVSTGPYAHVRHPMYSGLVLFYVGAPLLLGSYYGLAAAIVSAGILGMRAMLEEDALEGALPGYREYAARVRYRLVPGIW